jgi:hypothetical protein
VKNERNGPRFHIDDHVFFSTQGVSSRSQLPAERFIVVAVMPRDRAGIYQYRLRPTGTGPQRVATEAELRR